MKKFIEAEKIRYNYFRNGKFAEWKVHVLNREYELFEYTRRDVEKLDKYIEKEKKKYAALFPTANQDGANTSTNKKRTIAVATGANATNSSNSDDYIPFSNTNTKTSLIIAEPDEERPKKFQRYYNSTVE